ncbi:protein BUNDLE SHEATH DEFECTIVE [Salix suchowensis]|nr:protein BUNDLE SHEATH DEFECTIVE [Salix suchowensis]
MATVVNSTPLCSSVSLKNSAFIGNSVGGKFLRVKPVLHTCRFPSLEVKAVDGSNKSTKPNSIVCADCDGNGALSCTQCKGSGVNSTDHFNGQFKAGGLCWLCRGKREILCGNCNGAGFMGGFMSSFDS